MKKIAILIIVLVSLNSCYHASYSFSPESSRFGINFGKGKWLLNTVDSPSQREKLTEMALIDFKTYLNENLDYKADVLINIGAQNIPIHPDKERLEILKTSGYDYIINIKGKLIKDDLSSLQITPNKSPGVNSAKLTLEVYDLNLLEIIYIQEVLGIVDPDEIKEDFSLAVSTDQILIKSMKKILKKIKKNHSFEN